jgi:glucuronate isomerase
MLPPERYFSADPTTRSLARELYESVAGLPIVSPHGHVDPRLFSAPRAALGTPVDLFILPDHYVTRMLYSQGISLDRLGIPRADGGRVETDHRRIWGLFCSNFHLFRGTPSGIWLAHELSDIFGIGEKPCAANADRIFDALAEKMSAADFSPRALYERFNIEILATTDAATDTLEHHRQIRGSGWRGTIIPTFRPDGVTDLNDPNWRRNIQALSGVSGIEVRDYASFIRALEQRRGFFLSQGATASDHAPLTPAAAELTPLESAAIFDRALLGKSDPLDATRFTAHMLMEMARMSIEDGMVMQLHAGCLRNHNTHVFHQFGPDRGGDIPHPTEFTRNLLPLLNKVGNDPRLSLILFTLDESTYARELAPLAGHYPALKLGPPWWFHDSLNGMARYFDRVMETAGLYNTCGFNDDTRAFCSIPARHDLWRRASADWTAGLAARHIVGLDEAREMMIELASGLARRAYKLPGWAPPASLHPQGTFI